MDSQEVFTTLALRFNRTSLPLLDRDAFCRDVAYISHIAQDRDEFFELLQKQRDMRFKELQYMFDDGLDEIIHNPRPVPVKHWCDVMHIGHYNSFDTITRFFTDYMPAITGTPADPTPSASMPAAAAVTSSAIQADPALLQSAESHPQATTGTGASSNRARGTAAGSRRGHTVGASSSSSRIQNASQGTKGPRRSSRLRQPPTTQAGGDAETPSSQAGHKRKRGQQEEDGDLQQPRTTGAQGRPNAKKRRTDATGRGEPQRKRGRADPDITSTREKTANHRRNTHPPPEREKAGASSRPIPPRLTRARRQGLSGGDTQLFHLGKRGGAEVQPGNTSSRSP